MNEAIMKVKQENEHIKARTDSKAELIEPIDFSFKDLMKFEGNSRCISIKCLIGNK